MKTIIYNVKDFERPYLLYANKMKHELTLSGSPLTPDTIFLAKGHKAAVVSSGDNVSEIVLRQLKEIGIKYIAIRASGFDNIDIISANNTGIKCANIPEFSPHAVAEHSVALMLALNRKIALVDKQVHQNNFTIENVVGFNLNGKTVGIIGTGKIGSVVAKILHGFGCNLLGYDIVKNNELIRKYKLRYAGLKTLCSSSDIITLHIPLNSDTKYLINKDVLGAMKPGVMLINTARGAIIDTKQVIEALEKGKLAYLGMDVYEKENNVFLHDLSEKGIKDPVLKKLMNHPNVIITPHQAFATKESLSNIADTIFHNLDCWANNTNCKNEITSSDGRGTVFVPSPFRLKTVKIKLPHQKI